MALHGYGARKPFAGRQVNRAPARVSTSIDGLLNRPRTKRLSIRYGAAVAYIDDSIPTEFARGRKVVLGQGRYVTQANDKNSDATERECTCVHKAAKPHLIAVRSSDHRYGSPRPVPLLLARRNVTAYRAIAPARPPAILIHVPRKCNSLPRQRQAQGAQPA